MRLLSSILLLPGECREKKCLHLELGSTTPALSSAHASWHTCHPSKKCAQQEMQVHRQSTASPLSLLDED